MLVLAFDTSTPVVSVALVEQVTDEAAPQVIAGSDLPAHNAHGEVLAATIDTVLSHAGVAPAAVGLVGVGLGPGPFTGLRVGIVTAAAFADAVSVPAYGMCSLDAIAWARLPAPRPFAVLTDARRRQVYWAAYSALGKRVDGPDIGTTEDVSAALAGRGADLVGPGMWPPARVIAADAIDQCRRGEAPRPLEPMYLRRPDARPPNALKKVTPA